MNERKLWYSNKLHDLERSAFRGQISGIERCRLEQLLYKWALSEGITADEFTELSRKAYHSEKPANPPVYFASCSD